MGLFAHSIKVVSLDAQLSHLEPSFVYAGGFRPRSKNIHLVRQIIWPDYSLGLLEKAASMTVSIGI